ncbi:hypothetical protein L227DRAFT_589330 [Lentinus tigrinus ALCF2SS1-6]|uniref:F-box domain-containing protein n=1 Tax=Lentinus tigrinus ALCF2SS1-6 TaxID=1328759 RepID=A0A5C2RQ48_9APHY|nr:hypothetical protein L227DRAFT_589330 [Lentinus tigrinus ALCF2SS1-6]
MALVRCYPALYHIPLLWSRIDDRVWPRVLAFLQRSRSVPISVSTCLRGGLVDHNLLLKSSQDRLQRLDIRLEAADIFVESRLDFPVPCLEVFTLQCEIYGGVDVKDQPMLFCGETPSLCAMALLHVRHWLPANHFPNLIHLNISYFFMEELPLTVITNLLSNCPRLESLHFGQIWSYLLFDLDLRPPPAPVPLLKLRSLSSSGGTLQSAQALISSLILPRNVRIRIHDAPVQSHTTARENMLPSLTFLAPLTRLELAADSSRLYFLTESEDGAAAVWIQAVWDGGEPSVWYEWLHCLGEMLPLSAIRTLRISLRDWTLLPPLERMPSLAVLGVMSFPDDDAPDLMIAAVCAALTPTSDPDGVLPCPNLSTLSFQLCAARGLEEVGPMLARRAEKACRLSRLVVDRVRLPRPVGEEVVLDEDMLYAIGNDVDRLDVGEGGECTWEKRDGWDVDVGYWKLPAGDEARCVFPWQSAGE